MQAAREVKANMRGKKEGMRGKSEEPTMVQGWLMKNWGNRGRGGAEGSATDHSCGWYHRLARNVILGVWDDGSYSAGGCSCFSPAVSDRFVLLTLG